MPGSFLLLVLSFQFLVLCRGNPPTPGLRRAKPETMNHSKVAITRESRIKELRTKN